MTPNKKRESLAEFLFKEPRRPFSRYCVFADYLRIFLLFFRLSRRYTISSIYIYFFFAVGKQSLRKTPYLPNYICHATAVYLWKKLRFTAIFLVLPTSQFDSFINPIINTKNASETNATNNTPTNLKKERILAPPMFNAGLRQRCQPHTFRPTLPAPTKKKSTSDAT